MICRREKLALKAYSNEDKIGNLAKTILSDLDKGRTTMEEACQLIEIIIKGVR